MKKTIVIVLAILLAVVGIYYFMTKEQVVEDDDVKGESTNSEFIQCLVDSGMEVYASKTCPACSDFANSLGGYDAIANLFVFCDDDMDRCNEKMQTNFVPEIQINGEVYEGSRDLDSLADLTGCKL
jgi:hypothetical protein